MYRQFLTQCILLKKEFTGSKKMQHNYTGMSHWTSSVSLPSAENRGGEEAGEREKDHLPNRTNDSPSVSTCGLY